MNPSRRLVVVLCSCLVVAVRGAEEKTSSTVKEQISTLVKEDAKNQTAKPSNAAPAKTKTSPSPEPAATTPAPAKPEPAVAAPEKPVEPPTTLPTVEVNKRKITVLDHELYEQDKQIAREARNTKSTETDKALNAVSIPILGGASPKARTGVAQERIELMEMEKDITEAIAHAKTKEEKAELKKQLEDIRTMRRTLDTPR